MFKTVVIAALGFAAVSAQFLAVRHLQNTTTSTFNAAACSVNTAGVESGCNTDGYCCTAYTKTGTNVNTPPNICVATDFLGQIITI